MLTKNDVDKTLEDYDKLVDRAQHVYNRLYTELYKKHNVPGFSDWSCGQLFRGRDNYDMHVRQTDNKRDYVDFGTSDTDRDGDFIGYTEFKKEFLYDDEALTKYIKEEDEKYTEQARRQREREAKERQRMKEKKEAEERAEYERLKAKYGDT